jgi:molybdopterin/thiamine biosynthesis adenylyltransferase
VKRVTVVGVGALGSHVVQLLRNLEVTISVIDFDRVEQKNVMSQFYGKPSVGKLKADALKQQMQFLFGHKLYVNTRKLDEGNVVQLLDGAELVIDCLDNAESRDLLKAHCEERGIPCLHGALAADGAFGRVIWSEDFQPDEETPGAATCEDGEHLPFISITASFIAQAVRQFLVDGRRYNYNIFPTGVVRT